MTGFSLDGATLAEGLVGFHLALVFVLIARHPLGWFGGARWAYALWLLPVVRVILPPMPLFSLPAQSSPVYFLETGEGAAPLPSLDGSGLWMPLLLAVWAGGAVLFLLWQALVYVRLERSLARSSRPLSPFEGIEVLESSTVAAPLAMGFFHRRIVLPLDFKRRFSPAEQQLALRHETVHHRRGDLWWNLAALFLLAANWFSPLAHIAFRLFRTDQELACDAAVLTATHPSARLDYARALVKSASQPGLIAACPLNHADQLKRRLKMMTAYSTRRTAKVAGGAMAGALFLLGFTLSSANAQDGKKDEHPQMQKVIIKKSKDGTFELSGDIKGMIEKCQKKGGTDTTTEADGGTGKTRVIVCSPNGEMTAEQRAKAATHLEEALGEIQSADAKAAIQAEAKKLREGK